MSHQDPTAIELRTDWYGQASSLVPATGAEVSAPAFTPQGWYPVELPTTVLRALVRHGVYPDPRLGLNAFQIPDSSPEFNAQHDLDRFSHLPDQRNPWREPWWFRTELDLPALAPDQRAWLTLSCLNYRAELWVNGGRLAGPDVLVGMFQRFRLDVTAAVRPGRNALAILVHPVDHPGVPDTQLKVCGPVREFHKEICRDVTEVMTIGYDCFPTVPDRNMGLVQEVFLEVTGPVDLRHPFVRCRLSLPELDPAELTVSAELVNATAAPVTGVLEGEVTAPDTGETVAVFARPFVLQAHETQPVTVGPGDAPALLVRTPRLWWPNTYGDQPLYGLRLRARTGTSTSAQVQTTFGIRRIDRELHTLDGAHGFVLRVNGRRIFQRGGYVQPEMLFDWDAQRVEAELRYLAEARLNFVVFEDIPNPPDWYLDLCDQHGILFWNCFYGCYWLQPDHRWDVDLRVLEDATVDLVKRYRNHPSLVLYMAQNEGETRQDVYRMWRRTVLALDDTRFLVPSGSFPDYRENVPEWLAAELPAGMNDYPPKTYGWQLPAAYFQLVREARNWMFMIESCSASVPPLESLERFIPGLAERGPNPGDDPRYPLDPTWAHFGANAYFDWFDRGLRLLYGEPRDVRDYVWKAHLVAYDQHRAMFEAVHHRIWSVTSGFGQWKLNSAFPDVQWQVYDWFLRPMVSLFAIRRACACLSVLRCPLDGTVSVVNHADEPVRGLRVRATVYDLRLAVLQRNEAVVDAAGAACTDAFHVHGPASAAEHPVYFIHLGAHDQAGDLRADNLYWLSPRLEDCEVAHQGDLRQLPAAGPLLLPRQTPCMAELSALPPQPLTVRAAPCATDESASGPGRAAPAVCRPAAGSGPRQGDRAQGGAAGTAYEVSLANPGPGLALLVRLRLLRAADGEECLPAYWSDNYLFLLPGQQRRVRVEVPGLVAGAAHVIEIEGWNVPRVRQPV